MISGGGTTDITTMAIVVALLVVLWSLMALAVAFLPVCTVYTDLNCLQGEHKK